jgi:CheY-like chemotaxis protein
LEALAIARKEHPQLVLTDVMMPRMNGVELCRRLHEDPDTRGTVVLLMTAAGQFETGDCGAVGLLRKPFDLNGLSATVHGYLDGTVTVSPRTTNPLRSRAHGMPRERTPTYSSASPTCAGQMCR